MRSNNRDERKECPGGTPAGGFDEGQRGGAFPQREERIPLFTRLAFGSGGFSSAFIMQVFFTLAYPIYQVGLGVNPVWLGYALTVPRLLDFFIDPLIGNFSDNLKTRWGRRRPLILGGAGLCALILPLLWMPPSRDPAVMLAYFIAMSCVYTLGYAVFEVPYSALGYEMTDDYDERTRVLAWRMYMGLAGLLLMPWALKLCFLPVFGGKEIQGAPWVSAAISLCILGGALWTVLGVRERVPGKQTEIHVVQALKLTFTNKPFVMLMVVNLIVRVGIASIGPIAYYINIFDVCRLGDFQASKEFAATVSGWSGMLAALASYATLPAATWLASRGTKRLSMLFCLGLAALSSGSFWFTFDARWPYLQVVSAVAASAAMNGVWLLMISMIADVCDEDQLRTGMRREGMFGASYSVVEKLSFAAASTFGGLLLVVVGYDAQRALAGDVAPEVIARMKAIFVFAQCAALLVAIGVIAIYPLTRARALQVRRLLEQQESP